MFADDYQLGRAWIISFVFFGYVENRTGSRDAQYKINPNFTTLDDPYEKLVVYLV